jgi:nitrite reductase/ring-hydroxylating ferredoxin subunit
VLAEVERRLGRRLEPAAAAPSPSTGYEDLAGWFPQRGVGMWAAGLCPPLGRLSALQLEGVAVAAQRYGSGRLRTTAEQGVVVLDVRFDARDALATELARFDLSLHADSRVRNVVACTGKQFCNIAVTETKTHALQLIEQLRKRSLELHGVRVHMSGCPSSCGNHYTADIGLKGVRVRRLLGSREGFDVFLGGGVAGELRLAKPYKTGVDVAQLPQLVDDVVREYYLRHGHGETFSDYWRRKLQQKAPAAAAENEFRPPVWQCDCCGHQHNGVDPPVFCPQCTALRRHFARLDDAAETAANDPPAIDAEGFAAVAEEAAVPEGGSVGVCVQGRELALFRVDGQIRALDAACPHAGGSLVAGEVVAGVVTCPLHGWRFDTADGAAIEPGQGCVASYAVRVERGQILVQLPHVSNALASSLCAS